MKYRILFMSMAWLLLGGVNAQPSIQEAPRNTVALTTEKKTFWQRWFEPENALPTETETVQSAPTPRNSFWLRTWQRVRGQTFPVISVTETAISPKNSPAAPVTEAVLPTLTKFPVKNQIPTLPSNISSIVAQNLATPSPSDVFDTDGDMVLDPEDLCPHTPGDDTGCPRFEILIPRAATPNITLRRLNQVDYTYEEFDQIRLGDRFELQIVNPVSNTVIQTSDAYLVER